MKCLNCGAEMQPGHKFCEFCGAKAEPLVTRDTSRRESQYHSIKCHVCGAEVQPGGKYCEFCGAKIGANSSNNAVLNRVPMYTPQQSNNKYPVIDSWDKNQKDSVQGATDLNDKWEAIPKQSRERTRSSSSATGRSSSRYEDDSRSSFGRNDVSGSGETIRNRQKPDITYQRVNASRQFWKYLVLGILTLGFYCIWFDWHMIEDLNIACGYVEETDKDKSPSWIMRFLLQIITFGIYMYIWLYKQGQRLKNDGEKYGLDIKDKGSTYLLWSLPGALLLGIGPFIAIYKFINNCNRVCRRYNRVIKGSASRPERSDRQSGYRLEHEPSKGRKIVPIVIGAVVFVVVVLLVIGTVIQRTDTKLIDKIKKSENPDYPGVTYEQVMENYSKESGRECEWKKTSITDPESGKKVDAVSATFAGSDEITKITVFIVPTGENTADVKLASFGGEEHTADEVEGDMFNLALLNAGLPLHLNEEQQEMDDSLTNMAAEMNLDGSIQETQQPASDQQAETQAQTALQQQSETNNSIISSDNTNADPKIVESPAWISNGEIYANDYLRMYLSFKDYNDGNLLVSFGEYNGFDVGMFTTIYSDVQPIDGRLTYVSDGTIQPNARMTYSQSEDFVKIEGTDNGQFDGDYYPGLVHTENDMVVSNSETPSSANETVTLSNGNTVAVTQECPSDLIKLTNICAVLDGSLFADGKQVETLRCLLLEDYRTGYLADNTYIDQEFLKKFSAKGICYAKNEIYAKHGRIFNSKELSDYFNSCPWYSGTVSPENFSDSVFNEYEKANVQTIADYENQIGAYNPQ